MRPGFGLRGRRALIRRGSRGGGGLPAPAGRGCGIPAGTRSRSAWTRSRLSAILSLPTRRRLCTPFSNAFLIAEPRRATRPFCGWVRQDRLEVGVLVLLPIGTLEAGTLLVEVQDRARAARGAAAGFLGEVARLARRWRAGGPVVSLAQRREAAGLEDVAAEAQPVVVGRFAGAARCLRLGRVAPRRRCGRDLGVIVFLVRIEELAAAPEQLLGARGVAPGSIPGAVARAVAGCAVGTGTPVLAVGAVAAIGKRRVRSGVSPVSSGSPDSVREAERPRSTSKSKSKSSVMCDGRRRCRPRQDPDCAWT